MLGADGRSARLEVQDLPAVDEPLFPKSGPSYTALQSYRIVWRATGPVQTYADPTKHFLIRGYPTVLQAEVAVAVPDLNFIFQGRATATVVAIIGAEVNGYYADRGDQPPSVSAFPTAPLFGKREGS